MQSADIIIIGAGIVGLTIALEYKRRFPQSKILILEKEREIGAHASGRNSGVLHAGFYYAKDTLKAKLTRLGNLALTDYCLERKIPINRCGKLVVAQNFDDLKGLYELYERGKTNNIQLDLISSTDAKSIEPRVKTFEKALFSPTTSSVDPKAVLAQLFKDAIQAGIQIAFGTAYFKKLANKKILTNHGQLNYGYLINCAGLYADRIAKDFGFSKDFTILPFKGLYLYANTAFKKLNTHVYPVPNLKNPFLGVHFTISNEGHVKIGPTAIPALWREQYHLLKQFKLNEFFEIGINQLKLFFKADFNFRELAINEIKKYSKSHLVNHAAELISGIKTKDFNVWGKPGIRAQLLNIKKKTLEMDFIIEADKQSLHILNAVSPAFTCSFAFANFVLDTYF